MRTNRNRWIYIILIDALGTVLLTLARPSVPQDELSLKSLADEIEAGNIAEMSVKENDLTITRTDGSQALSRKEADISILKTLREMGVSEEALSGVAIHIKPPSIMDY